MSNLRLEEDELFAQGHMASKGQIGIGTLLIPNIGS